MSLATFQKTLYEVLLGTESQQMLKDSPSFTTWLNQSNHLDIETRQLLQQPSIGQLQQYQWMVYSNLADTLSSVYPYTRQLLKGEWEKTVHRFIAQYPPHTYQLYACVTDFPEFLSADLPVAWLERYPFLVQLAEYEVLEARILRAENKLVEKPSTEAILQTSHLLFSEEFMATHAPIINPIAEGFVCHYPLQDIVSQLQQPSFSDSDNHPGPIVVTTAPSTTLYWVYRDKEHHCRFFQVNPVVYTFLEYCLNSPHDDRSQSYEIILLKTLDTVSLPYSAELAEKCSAFLNQLMETGILCGSIPLDVSHPAV